MTEGQFSGWQNPLSGGRRDGPSSLNVIRAGPRGRAPVVFLHPLGLDLTYWSDQIETLSAEQDVIAFDWPGSGRSSGAAADWNLEQATEVVATVIRDSGSAKAHIVGSSIGGMVAQQVAIDHSEMVQSLILVATAPTFSDSVRDGMRARAAEVRSHGMTRVVRPSIERWLMPETVQARPALVDRITKTILLHNPEVHAAMWEMVAEFDVLDHLARVRTPTLILVGDSDQSTPVTSARLLQRGIRGSQMEVVAGASHMVQLERASMVSTAIKEFIRIHET